MLRWAPTLYLARRHAEGQLCPDPDGHQAAANPLS